MVMIHNGIIRGYNSVLYYAGQVDPQSNKFASFINYCAAMNHTLHHHHANEEEFWFPFLEEKVGSGCMKANLDAHQEFLDSFEIFEKLVKSLQAKEIDFDVTQFRDAIHVWMPTLRAHLESEISTFSPGILHEHVQPAELQAIEATMAKDIMASISLVNDIQVFYVNGDSVHGAWFPPVPGPIGFLVKYVLWYAHSDMWAFGSCNRNMEVKPQFAAYEPAYEDQVAKAT